MKEHQLMAQMAEEMARIKKENELLKEALKKSHETIINLSARLDILDQRAAAKAHRTFTSGSERLSKDSDIVEPETPIDQDTQLNEAETELYKSEPIEKKERKKGCGRSKIDPSIPREEIILSPKDYELLCSSCHKDLKKIGEDVVEILEYVPGSLKVVRYVRASYACPSCKSAGVIQASIPQDRIIRGGMVGNGLVAASLSDKFIYHLPYARQSIRFTNIGFEVSRQNLSRWQITVSTLLSPIVQSIEDYILSKKVIHLDETTLQVLGEEGRANTTNSYIWLRVYDGPEPGAVSYRYFPTRAKIAAKELLDDYEGTIQTDAYGAYKSIVKQKDGSIKQAFCLAHCRRKFYDIYVGSGGKKKKKKAPPSSVRTISQIILQDIAKIFHLESMLREKLYTQKISEDEFIATRIRQAEPLFTQLKEHLDSYKKTVLPKTPLFGAIQYTLNQWDGLQVYLQTPLLTPDNSSAERSVKPVALGRRNWNFSGSPAGAKSSCDMYTILQTAALNKLDPGAYLQFVLEAASPLVELPYDKEQWDKLLPWNIDPATLKWQDRIKE